MEKIPKNGTKRAVDYWAVRARESFQVARAIITTEGPNGRALDWARQAAGEAAEFEQAVEALVRASA